MAEEIKLVCGGQSDELDCVNIDFDEVDGNLKFDVSGSNPDAVNITLTKGGDSKTGIMKAKHVKYLAVALAELGKKLG